MIKSEEKDVVEAEDKGQELAEDHHQAWTYPFQDERKYKKCAYAQEHVARLFQHKKKYRSVLEQPAHWWRQRTILWRAV